MKLIKAILYAIKRMILSIFGDIKVYRWPFFFIYSPDSFEVKGTHTRETMNIIEPGDIIQRKYVHYLDGYFIPGKYSHTGVYIGDNTVIHAIAEGVSKIDLIDFMRTDAIRVLRPKSGQEYAINKAVEVLDTPYDFSFKDGESHIYCHELAAMCYPELNVVKVTPKLFGLSWGAKPCYLSESFDTDDFNVVYEFLGF